MPGVRGLRDPQRLAKRGLELLDELVDPRLQALVLVHERIADQHARHPLVLFGKAQQHDHRLLGLGRAVFRLGLDLVHEREHRRFDELDQTLEHLRLAGEMPVERSLRHVELCSERGGRDLLATRRLEHRRKRLQDLQLAFAGLARHRRGPRRRQLARCGGVPSARIIVPTPSLVRTSSSNAWSTRPSMMCELLTPFFTASSAEPIFGSMPPLIVPSANSASISLAERPVRRLPCLSSTPAVLVISTSFSAFSVSASLPATRSALMLYASPSWPTPIG